MTVNITIKISLISCLAGLEEGPQIRRFELIEVVNTMGGEVITNDGRIGVEKCRRVAEDDSFETVFFFKEGE